MSHHRHTTWLLLLHCCCIYFQIIGAVDSPCQSLAGGLLDNFKLRIKLNAIRTEYAAAFDAMDYVDVCQAITSKRSADDNRILAIYWLRNTGYPARIENIVKQAGDAGSSATAAALCDGVLNESNGARAIFERDMSYIRDDFFENHCTDLSTECGYDFKCIKLSTGSGFNRQHDIRDQGLFNGRWRSGEKLPNCPIAKHSRQTHRIQSKLNALHDYYVTSLDRMKSASVAELTRDDRSTDIASLDRVHEEATGGLQKILDESNKLINDPNQTALGLCLRTLSDMQTTVEDCGERILSIRESSWKCHDIKWAITQFQDQDNALGEELATRLNRLKLDISRKIDGINAHLLAWLQNRHQMHAAHQAELRAQFESELVKLHQIAAAAKLRLNALLAPTEIDFKQLTAFCPGTSREMKNAAIHIERMQIKLLSGQTVQKVQIFIEDALPLPHHFTEDNLSDDLATINADISRVTDRKSIETEIAAASRPLRDKLRDNFDIWRTNIAQALNIIETKKSLCRPFLCATARYETMRATLVEHMEFVQRELEHFVATIYNKLFDTEELSSEILNQAIEESYRKIYNVIMDNDSKEIVDQLIRIDFDYFHAAHF